MRPLHSGYRVSKPDGGPECERLERELEAYYEVRHARVFNSATSALHASLAALGIGPGDEVLVPAYSMSASASAILHAGATPVFCDIGDDYCLDWSDALGRMGIRTKAVVLVHLFGHHATVSDALPDSIAVVHDAAQSPSVQPRLSAHRREIWCYSLNQHKIIHCGEGGYALCDDVVLSQRLHAVRNHGECYTDDILGYNYRMTEMQAHVALNEFRQLDQRLAERRRWAGAMSALYGIRDDGNRDWFLYPVRVAPDQRAAVAERMRGRVGYHRPIYSLPYYRAHGYADVSLPNVERIESELVVIDPLDDER